jgi:uncharacterized membrane protein
LIRHAGKSTRFYSALCARIFLTGILVTAPIDDHSFTSTYVFIRFMDTPGFANILPNSLQPAYGDMRLAGSAVLSSRSYFFITVSAGSRPICIGQPRSSRLSEYIIHRMPIIRTLYKSVKQVIETSDGLASARLSAKWS